MIGRLSSLLSLLSRALARNLTLSAFARRRLEKSSIYLSGKWVSAQVVMGSLGNAWPCDNSDNSANRLERPRPLPAETAGGGKTAHSASVGIPA